MRGTTRGRRRADEPFPYAVSLAVGETFGMSRSTMPRCECLRRSKNGEHLSGQRR
jgi:hypothetical protein